LQSEVDEVPTPGRFVLTGSQHFALSGAVSQSLAGRAAVTELLPLSVSELASAHLLEDVWSTVFKGGYPAIYARKMDPLEWFSSYVATYVERDVRQILNVTDLVAFERFLSLAAARTSQLLDHNRLGSDVGISQPTARKWFTVLEASYITYRLPPFVRNLGKRLVKTPKIHFFDSGLLCYLLRIRSPEQLRLHPLRGPIFESWVVSEIGKVYRNRGQRPNLTFFRDHHGLEVDVMGETGLGEFAVEVKSSETVASDALSNLNAVRALIETSPRGVGSHESILVHAGTERWQSRGVTVLPWSDIGGYPWPD